MAESGPRPQADIQESTPVLRHVMCDTMLLSLGTQGMSEKQARSAIEKLIAEAGLGAEFKVRLRGKYNMKALVDRLRSSLTASTVTQVPVELLSAPDADCMCDALPDAENPASKPLLRFLRELFGSPFASSVSLFVGPVWVAQTEAANDCTVYTESQDVFLKRLRIGGLDTITGLGVGGIFRIQPSRARGPPGGRVPLS